MTFFLDQTGLDQVLQSLQAGAAWATAFTPTDNTAAKPLVVPPSATGAEHIANLYAYAEWLDAKKPTTHVFVQGEYTGNNPGISDGDIIMIRDP